MSDITETYRCRPSYAAGNNYNNKNIYIHIALIQSSKRFTSDYKFQQLRVLESPQQRLTYLKH